MRIFMFIAAEIDWIFQLLSFIKLMFCLERQGVVFGEQLLGSLPIKQLLLGLGDTVRNLRQFVLIVERFKLYVELVDVFEWLCQERLGNLLFQSVAVVFVLTV